jgi:hypothetical protein
LSAQVRGQIDAFMHPMEYGSWMRYDAELVRDAMRYRALLRWIDAPIGGRVATVVFWGDHGPNEPSAAELSADIDTAIAQAEGGEG